MRGEIITIGDELIMGKVCDLNSFFLSGRITSYGLKIESFTSIGDDPDRISEVLGRAVQRSDFVIVSGGLGPTDDDMTARAAADFFGLPLKVHDQFLASIKKSLSDRGMAWIESYRKLAVLPEGARLIDPELACGFYLYSDGVPVFFLPGIPSEVRTLAESKVLPILLEMGSTRGAVKQRVFKLFGIHEARIGELLDGLNGGDDRISVGFYPNFPENHVTVTARAESETGVDRLLEQTEVEVKKRIGEYVVAMDDATLEESAGRELARAGYRLAVAESCTGGLICHRLTGVSGSSDYFERGFVVYSNQAKMDHLGVPESILAEHGAVSAETARAMAEGAKKTSGADLGLASTGIAGPTGGTPEKPVGTVYIGIAGPDGTAAKRYRFTGGRGMVKELTAETALAWLFRYLSLGPWESGPIDAAPRLTR